MNSIAFLFLILVGAVLVWTAVRLGLSIYLDYRAAAEVREQLLQRLRLLPMRPLLAAAGLDLQEVLYCHPLHQVEKLIRACESCPDKERCQASLSRGGGRSDCPARKAFLNEN